MSPYLSNCKLASCQLSRPSPVVPVDALQVVARYWWKSRCRCQHCRGVERDVATLDWWNLSHVSTSNSTAQTRFLPLAIVLFITLFDNEVLSRRQFHIHIHVPICGRLRHFFLFGRVGGMLPRRFERAKDVIVLPKFPPLEQRDRIVLLPASLFIVFCRFSSF